MLEQTQKTQTFIPSNTYLLKTCHVEEVSAKLCIDLRKNNKPTKHSQWKKKTGWINSQNNHQCSQDACFFSFIQPPEINMLKKFKTNKQNKKNINNILHLLLLTQNLRYLTVPKQQMVKFTHFPNIRTNVYINLKCVSGGYASTLSKNCEKKKKNNKCSYFCYISLFSTWLII